ncbi:MAG: hypothetical protein KDB07_01005 [Planctomycetes bacterium]|nr:hypothetical protein [Planctomycetota bacterium]
MIRTIFAFTCLVALVSGCKSEPHTYKVPEGVGTIRYSNERGIYREGQGFSEGVERLWQEANIAFEERRYTEARDLLRRFRFEPDIVDSSRAVDAVLLESVVEFESGRPDDDADWRLHDLANAWLDPVLDAASLQNLPKTLLSAEGSDEVKKLALALTNSGEIEDAFEIQELIFEHYTDGLGAVPSKLIQLSREMRNCSWFAYVGENYELAINIAKSLLARSPRDEIRATTQLVLAQSYIKVERYQAAVTTYQDVFTTARDPDLREEALYGEIQALIASSKGWEYNREPFEQALEKLNEYKIGFLTVYRDAKMARDFAEVERTLHDILYRKDKESSTTYSRLLREQSSRFYRDVAGRRRDTQIKAEDELRRIYNKGEGE